MKVWKLSIMAATMAVTAGLLATPASADSGDIYSGGNDCVGRWESGTDLFWIMDKAGGNDDDYCYIDYGPTPSSKNSGKRRVTITEDSAIGRWQSRTPDLSGVGGTIYFKVCEERENDPDLCSNVGGYQK